MIVASSLQRRRRMKQSGNAEPLANITIFSALPLQALEAINRHCSWRRYEAGESILAYLDQSDEVFFVAEGEVYVTIYSSTGKAVNFRNLGPGSIFGEYAAIDGAARCASVEARTPCLVASMGARAFRKLLETEMAVSQALIRDLVKNIRTLTKRVYEFSTLAVNNRIQGELLRLASLAPKDGKGARVAPAPTHSEIASRVSTHREAVTRELNRLVRIGIIERQDKALIIRDVERLAAMLHEMTGE
jgi:CRP/FNR family transcriptional regulator, cyclic AMP receptor protein